MSPNLFRGRDVTNLDLINQGNLADIFTVLMNNTEYISSRILKDDGNFAEFEQMISQNNGSGQTKSANRTSGWHDNLGIRGNQNSNDQLSPLLLH